MSTLNPNNYAYLWSPTRQILNMDGKPLIGGYIMLDRYGTVGIPAESYCDWNGTLNARQILLDSLGRATAIVESDKLYNMYVYNKYNVLQYSALGVNCCSDGDSGSSPMSFTSRDGSLTITRSGSNVDFSVNKDPSSYGSAVADSVDESGALVFNGVTGDLTIVSANTLSLNDGKMYHITVQAKVDIAESMDSYNDCVMRDSENTAHPFIIDGSRASQYVDLSWDMVATHDYFRLYFEIPEGADLDEVALYIHSVTSVNVSASAEYTAGNMISIEDHEIGVDTTAGITDIQVVNELPASPVSTVLYLIPES